MGGKRYNQGEGFYIEAIFPAEKSTTFGARTTSA